MKFFKTIFTPLLAIALFATSCKKEETNPGTPVDDPLSEYVLISETSATTLDYTVKVYAQEALFVGYNYILVQVKDNATGEILDNPDVMFMPVMEMNSGMMHACPLEQPTYNTSLQVMEGTITFVMPSMGQGKWNLGLKLKNTAGTEEDINIDVDVMQKAEPQLFSFVSTHDPNQNVFVALVNPRMPQIGINDFEVVAYERQSMMSWPALEMLNIEIDPEMPTMGHGSPNNVNPIDMGEGHYLGKVNFTMSGYWKVNMKFETTTNEMMMDDAFFDITF
jgi:hypothetical protein